MNLREFQDAASVLLATAANPRELKRVSSMACNLAEMVGWAPGIIDPRGEAHAALEVIRSSAGQLYQANGMPEVAILHDAVAGLMDAIAGHDRDLEPGGADFADIVDSW